MQLIGGKAGSGKTRKLFEKVEEAIKEGKKVAIFTCEMKIRRVLETINKMENLDNLTKVTIHEVHQFEELFMKVQQEEITMNIFIDGIDLYERSRNNERFQGKTNIEILKEIEEVTGIRITGTVLENKDLEVEEY